MIHQDAESWISDLGLNPHPEGGFYKQINQSSEALNTRDLSSEFKGDRQLYTSIYFLLRSQDVSHFHRLKSDELWFFHSGSSLTIHIIHDNGMYEKKNLGLDSRSGEVLQFTVPKNTIFGSSLRAENSYSLVSCVVSPGFDFADFELFNQRELLDVYPEHEDIIKRLTLK